uniref:Trichohyalin-plectin-homology domain-containing protein n=1 Tax=Mucochytrium quahogii TaxID=96639 RepID=A0A7S2R6N2_9STRA|mmetsp:Transcript_10413/g.22594  ORF Transcript_10413/g.22594 Transcript_10413/m.22594 type:complete len:463 (+) Transcript_10413:74-1462(+)
MHPFKQAKLPSDYQILRRRQEEDRRAKLESGIKQEQRYTSVASWGHKSTQAMERQRIRQRASERMQHYETALNLRRQKLAQLLQEERTMYEREFQNSFETPDQRRERMAEKAKKLKEDREQKRRALAAQCLQQRNRLAQDEMRNEQSRMRTLKVAQDRKGQLRERKQQQRALKREEDEFAEQWARSIDAKVQREEQERLMEAQRNKSMRQILDSQVEDLNNRKKLQEQELEETRAKWRLKWAQEEEEAKRKVLEREHEQRLARVAVQQENLERASKRAESSRIEQEIDRYLLKEALEKDAEAEAIQLQKRIALQKTQKQFQAHLREMAIKEAADESELELIRQKESEKEWDKRAARWKREAEERERLMEEVNIQRAQQIEEKRRLAYEQRLQDQEYIRKTKLQDEAIAEECKKKEQKDKEHQEIYQSLLWEQMREKERIKAIEKQREALLNKRAELYTEQFT